MSHETIAVARLLFWVLVAACVALPVQWGVIAYVLLAQFDLTGTAFYSSELLGWENAVKIAVVPTLLFLKVRPEFSMNRETVRTARTWLLLAAYAALSVVWSPFKLSGTKMLGYFYAYTALFAVFTVAWRNGWFTTKALMGVLWASLGFAVLQTYALGNDYGSFAANNGTMDYEWRFTTFGSAQSFAAFLLCMLVLLLFRERRNFFVLLSCSGATAGILLTGSRSIFIGFAWILVMAGVILAKTEGKRLTLGLAIKRMAISGAVILCMAAVVLKALPENRLNQMLSAAVTSNNSVQDVGTFLWRFNLYEKTVDELRGRSAKALIAGTGTSSAATLVLQTGIFSESNVDPNRALHDEFLRSTYEWGLIGLGLLLLFLYQVISICFEMIRNYDAREAWAFLAILVPLLISLAVENFLADSASPGGVGYNLLLTSMLTCASVYGESQSPAMTSPVHSLTFHSAGGAWNQS
jgi:O-antigen ligase/polysaccharide polymerase Wzy-like membrane protein